MCRWHKLAAKEAATNPITGEFHVGQYAVALTAMGLFRIEQKQWKMAELFEIDGFNPNEVLEENAWQAFEQSGLRKNTNDAQLDLSIHIANMRHALEETALSFDLNPDALDIKDRITKDGYKTTCCAAPNPRENGPFLDAAVVYLAKGYDDTDRSYATGKLSLIDSDELEALKRDPSVAESDRQYIPVLEGVRGATEYFLVQPNIMQALEGAFSNSIALIFQTAEDDLKAGRGLEGPSDCIMCEGAKGRKPDALNLG
jgi:hypothetical protein